MGYIQYGRHSFTKILRSASATNVFRNSVRSPLGYAATTLPSCSHFHGKSLYSTASDARVVMELLKEVEKDRLREKNERLRAGLDTADIDAETEDGYDYMGVSSLIEKLEKEKLKETSELNRYEEPTDSDSDDEEDLDANQKKVDDFERKFRRHEEMIQNFTEADTLDDAYKWMQKIDKFEDKHFKLRTEYRVIGELMNRLKVVTEQKDRFILQHKLNRALRLVQWKEAYDPDNPANYGLIQQEQGGANMDTLEQSGFEKEDKPAQGDEDAADNDDEVEFDDMKEKDNILLAKLDVIDKRLEEKLAELEYTFGRKGKALEEEIKDLAEERNELTEKKRRPLFRKGFDVKLIDVNRTCKVTKAYEKCFQNLHYIERHEEHTIAHAIQTSYKKTKVYLWPASTATGMKAGRIVQTILHLAGFKNVKSKVVGQRNPHNTVKAVFKALNAIETPKDVQEKFGRTVVEKYLL